MASNSFHSPSPIAGVPASIKDALALLAQISGRLEKGESVAIHCRQSVGRSGLIAAGLLIRSGMTAEAAIAAVTAARRETIPETDAQLQWIKHLSSEQLALTR